MLSTGRGRADCSSCIYGGPLMRVTKCCTFFFTQLQPVHFLSIRLRPEPTAAEKHLAAWQGGEKSHLGAWYSRRLDLLKTVAESSTLDKLTAFTVWTIADILSVASWCNRRVAVAIGSSHCGRSNKTILTHPMPHHGQSVKCAIYLWNLPFSGFTRADDSRCNFLTDRGFCCDWSLQVYLSRCKP